MIAGGTAAALAAVALATLVILPPPPAHVGAPVARRVDSSAPAAADTSGTGWQLTAIDLDVVATPDSGTLRVAGTLRLVAPAGGSLGPDLVVAPNGMAFDSVAAPGAAARLNANRDTARLRLDRPADAGTELAVTFAARARQPRVARAIAVGADGAFASWFGNWYPWPAATKGVAPDNAARGTLRVTIPAAWHSLANGRLVDSAAVAGTRRETWTSARELAWSVIAADYDVSRRRVGATDVGIYLMPRQRAKAADFATAIPPMVATLEKAYGPYPFETFGLAAIPESIAPPGIGGRSEQGYFLAHEHALDANTVDVPFFAHELAHMWWANSVNADPPGDDMMDEGMASHGGVLVIEARAGGGARGRAAARAYLHDGSRLFSARGFFHLWRVGGDQRLMNDFATFSSYAKGPWVLEMLRDRVGDSLYFATVRAFVREYTGRSATLVDLRAAFLRAAPAAAGLERFFADWLDRPGAPVLDVAWADASAAGRPLARVRLTQRTAPYHLPLEVEVQSATGPLRTTVALTDSVQTFVLPSRGRPTGVRLDPAHRVLLWRPEFGPVPNVTAPRNLAEGRAWLRQEIMWLRRQYGATGLSVAVVDRGAVAWTVAGGVAGGVDGRGPNATPVTAATAFPLGDFATAARSLDSARYLPTRTHATAPELASLLVDLLAAGAGRGGGRVSAAAARAVLTPGAPVQGDPLGATTAGGAGFRLATKKGAARLSLVSTADGQVGVMIGYPQAGQGCVILTNDSRIGLGLATQVAERIAVVYGWPEIPGRD